MMNSYMIGDWRLEIKNQELVGRYFGVSSFFYLLSSIATSKGVAL